MLITMCHVCGNITKDLPLSIREWVCDCGVKHDRDVNAAINLKMAASSAVTACGHGSTGYTSCSETAVDEAGKIMVANAND